MKVNRLIFSICCLLMTIVFSCEKDNNTAICEEGQFPRSENVIYNAHFNSLVLLEPLSLQAYDTLKLYQIFKDPDTKDNVFELRTKAFKGSGVVSYEFAKEAKYIMISEASADAYKYLYENLCK